MSYNPFNTAEMAVEVGQYTPTIDTDLYETENEVSKKIEPDKAVGKVTIKDSGAVDFQTINPETQQPENNLWDSSDNEAERCQEIVGEAETPPPTGIYGNGNALYLDFKSIPFPRELVENLPADVQNDLWKTLNFIAGRGGAMPSTWELIQKHPLGAKVQEAIDLFNEQMTYGTDWNTGSKSPVICISTGVSSLLVRFNYGFIRHSTANSITQDSSNTYLRWSNAITVVSADLVKTTNDFNITIQNTQAARYTWHSNTGSGMSVSEISPGSPYLTIKSTTSGSGLILADASYVTNNELYSVNNLDTSKINIVLFVLDKRVFNITNGFNSPPYEIFTPQGADNKTLIIGNSSDNNQRVSNNPGDGDRAFLPIDFVQDKTTGEYVLTTENYGENTNITMNTLFYNTAKAAFGNQKTESEG
jgi:hypothetical protein